MNKTTPCNGSTGRLYFRSLAGSELRGEVKPDVLEVFLCQGQGIAGVRPEIHRGRACRRPCSGMFAPFEVGQLLGVVALDPAGFVDGDRLPAAGGVVFVRQAVFDHFELQGAYRADDLAAVERRG